MSDRFACIYDGPVHTIFLASTTTVSVLSNGLLLHIIFSRSSSSIGQYGYLLAVFAVCDVATSFSHVGLQAVVHMTSTGAILFPRYGGNMLGAYSLDTFEILLFIIPYYQTFLILVYHFVYRYIAVLRGITSSTFCNRWSTFHWIVLAVVIYVLFIAAIAAACGIGFSPDDEKRKLVPPVILDLYGVDLRNPNRGFMMIAVKTPNSVSGKMAWHVPTLICLFSLIAMFGGTASVMAYCIFRTISIIKYRRYSHGKISEKTRKMQVHLFNALLIQSAVPMLFSYLPLGVVLAFPIITGISLGSFGNVLYLITTIFPSIDAFFVLYFIHKFRTAALRLFHLGSRSVPLSSNS